jgi:hypothetical protein
MNLTIPVEVSALPIADMFQAFGMDIKNHFLHRIEELDDGKGSQVLVDCVNAAVASLGPERLLEIGARPSYINSMDAADIEFLLPPVVAFSSRAGKKLQGSTYGLAKKDKKFVKRIHKLCAVTGAAERLTILRDGDLHQFCPHRDACPHFASGLCFRWFAPPSLELELRFCSYVDGHRKSCASRGLERSYGHIRQILNFGHPSRKVGG